MRRRLPLLAGVLSCALLLLNTASWREDLWGLHADRRYWEDLSLAVARVLADPADPRAPVSIGSWQGQEQRQAYQRYVYKAVAARGLAPWQFWRTIQMARFAGGPRLEGRPSDDSGRAALLAAGFRVLGGVAPYLPLWLGALAAVPILLWTSWELSRAGCAWAAALFPLALTSSPYFVQALSLPYSAVGFYLLGLLLLVPLATYAVLGSCRARGLALRVLAAALAFAVCALCRAGAVLLLPGYVLAIAAGVWRGLPASPATPAARRGRGAALTIALVFLLVLPYALVRPARHHEIWLGVWEGLGDFDRTKGHYWHDPYAKALLRAAGIDAPAEKAVWAEALENEAFFREHVIADVLDDPGWYVAILAKRLGATLTQWKLAPYGPRDGRSMEPARSPQEGVIDDYYGLATTADFFGFATWRREVPLALLLAPTVALAAIGLARRTRAGGTLLLLACLASSALVSPVLITTAGGIETEAFALLYLVGAALLPDALLRARAGGSLDEASLPR